MTESRLDGLNLFLLTQMGILAIEVLHFLLPAFSTLQIGVVFCLAVLIPLLGIRMVCMTGSRLDEVNLALLMQVGAVAIIAANGWLPTQLQPLMWWQSALPASVSPSPASPLAKVPLLSAVSRQELGGIAVPLAALVSLFGIRARRIAGSGLDGLGLLLLSQIGILAISAVNLLPPNFGIWRSGMAILLATLILLSWICIVRMKESKLNEVNLTLFMQIGMLAIFFANGWLPFLWTQVIAGAFLLAALPPFLYVRMVRTKESRLSEVDLALLALMGVFVLFVANQWLPSPWDRIVEGAAVFAALAAVLWLHRERLIEGKFNEVMLLLAAIGILLVVAFGFWFPVASWALT